MDAETWSVQWWVDQDGRSGDWGTGPFWGFILQGLLTDWLCTVREREGAPRLRLDGVGKWVLFMQTGQQGGHVGEKTGSPHLEG